MRAATRSLLAAALLVLLCGAVLQHHHVRADEERAAAAGAVAAAEAQATALLSYRPETASRTLHAAEAALAPGPFHNRYADMIEQRTIPAAKNERIGTSAEIAGSAWLSGDDERARVLLFVNQTSRSGDDPPESAGSRIEVTVTRADGDWRIVEFRPI
ncbi:twin-arginine translocation pathway signal [Tomitella fengzijianii]|uniref:Twin-arginine translocation pathway signal n=1 Tax=Tomitella fengzijianii TaxID=2597660 RepID=A0A516X6H3_9ACTN|nr:twin-arginine translocation pathway signal [Tomitella fengzijianii]QDQ98655.1 twin-arginine translocation pathway signal [Tomitella fengzijianii]